MSSPRRHLARRTLVALLALIAIAMLAVLLLPAAGPGAAVTGEQVRIVPVTMGPSIQIPTPVVPLERSEPVRLRVASTTPGRASTVTTEPRNATWRGRVVRRLGGVNVPVAGAAVVVFPDATTALRRDPDLALEVVSLGAEQIPLIAEQVTPLASTLISPARAWLAPTALVRSSAEATIPLR